ncbi:MAG: SpoIIE family protein phosphatase [Hyphomicrobiaceae bacterium]
MAPRQAPPAGTKLVIVLSDGMGGHAAGDVASRTACAVFLGELARQQGDTIQRLGRSLHAANAGIRDTVQEAPHLNGMGATLVGVHFSPGGAEWISVGDSPLFLYRRRQLARLNADHSLSPLLDQLVAEGKMSAQDAKADPRRHYLRSAITGEELDLIDASDAPLRLEADDIVLLASDGLLTLEEEEIRDVITAHVGHGLDAVADALMRAVDAAGDLHQDNTTLIVVGAQLSGLT